MAVVSSPPDDGVSLLALTARSSGSAGAAPISSGTLSARFGFGADAAREVEEIDRVAGGTP